MIAGHNLKSVWDSQQGATGERDHLEVNGRSIFHYSAFGRVVETDIALSGVSACSPSPANLRISRTCTEPRSVGDMVFESEDGNGGVNFRLYLHEHEYAWLDGLKGAFSISRTGNSVRWHAPQGPSADLVATLSGPVLGFALQLQGLVALHGSAASWEGLGFGVLAPSGYGKSTLVSVLLRRGCFFLSDDVLALERSEAKAVILPSFRRLKLWPDSLQNLFPDGGWMSFGKWSSDTEKRILPADDLGEVCDGESCLTALFVLVPVDAQSEARAVRLSGMEELVAVLSNSYQAHLLVRETALVSARMDFLGDVIQKVPVYALACPRSLSRLNDIVDSLLARLVEDLR